MVCIEKKYVKDTLIPLMAKLRREENTFSISLFWELFPKLGEIL